MLMSLGLGMTSRKAKVLAGPLGDGEGVRTTSLPSQTGFPSQAVPLTFASKTMDCGLCTTWVTLASP